MNGSVRPLSINLNGGRKNGNKDTPFWFGGLACSIATLCTHPQDLLKVRLQCQPNAKLFPTLNSIIKTEGISKLYSGLSASLLRQMTYSTVRFGSYDKLKTYLTLSNGDLPFHRTVIAGIVAGCVGGVLGLPFDLINVRMQFQNQHFDRVKYTNVYDGLTKVLRSEGFINLFSGCKVTMVRSIIMTVSQLTTYDFIKSKIQPIFNSTDNFNVHLISSLLTGVVCTTTCSPLDVIKTRTLVKLDNLPVHRSLIRTGIDIVNREGFKALFKGWVPSYLRLGPHTLITLTLLDYFKSSYLKSNFTSEHKSIDTRPDVLKA